MFKSRAFYAAGGPAQTWPAVGFLWMLRSPRTFSVHCILAAVHAIPVVPLCTAPQERLVQSQHAANVVESMFYQNVQRKGPGGHRGLG